MQLLFHFSLDSFITSVWQSVSAGCLIADNPHSIEKLVDASGDILCKNSVFEQGKFYL